MRLFVEEIKDEGLTLDFEESDKAFPQLVDMVENGECTFTQPVSGSLRARKVGDLIEIDGHVETTLRLACSRCLGDFDRPVESEFSVAFTSELPEVPEEDEEGLEVSAEEMGLNLYHGDVIELDAVIAEQVILTLPVKPLCGEDCRGLCPKCGADLNKGDCGCEQKPFLDKFAALKDFTPEKE
ncbi:MAG: DUF177 domain-containing protein [Desulfuromonadales bacterium]